jgi:hypothetical protein
MTLDGLLEMAQLRESLLWSLWGAVYHPPYAKRFCRVIAQLARGLER